MRVSCGRSQVKIKSDEGRVVAVGDGKYSPPGSGDRDAPDICGQETGDSDGVGGPTAYFRRLCKRDGLLGRRETTGAMVEADSIGYLQKVTVEAILVAAMVRWRQ